MLENYKKMDINMLLSIVNMKLRNESKTLDDLCATYEIDKPLLVERLEKNDFVYDPAHHQFKQRSTQ
jgi:hypothetical protein